MNAYHAVGMSAHALLCAGFIPEEQGRILAQVSVRTVHSKTFSSLDHFNSGF